jgi:hypothetical protein
MCVSKTQQVTYTLQVSGGKGSQVSPYSSDLLSITTCILMIKTYTQTQTQTHT